MMSPASAGRCRLARGRCGPWRAGPCGRRAGPSGGRSGRRSVSRGAAGLTERDRRRRRRPAPPAHLAAHRRRRPGPGTLRRRRPGDVAGEQIDQPLVGHHADDPELGETRAGLVGRSPLALRCCLGDLLQAADRVGFCDRETDDHHPEQVARGVGVAGLGLGRAPGADEAPACRRHSISARTTSSRNRPSGSQRGAPSRMASAATCIGTPRASTRRLLTSCGLNRSSPPVPVQWPGRLVVRERFTPRRLRLWCASDARPPSARSTIPGAVGP
jgi:hypothetical protein